MPGLHPFQNATPRQQIPNEAPQYFSPFFEQPAKPPPVTIWQPPNVELPRRSKAPTHRPRSPPKIPTAGTWTRNNSLSEDKPTPTGLFQPKKRSGDEIMWLGSVTGFSLPEPTPPAVQRSLRSKLVRKPEEIPSQASSATGPKATEAKRTKEEEARARERRLEEWATRKKPNATDKQPKRSDGSSIPLPQPIESRLRPRKKVYTPLLQTEDNRPNAIHRPHMPSDDEGSYAPNKPFLPQPIETVKRSNRRPVPIPKKLKSEEEETLWMGLPQPVESSRRTHRKSPLNKMQSVDDQDGDVPVGGESRASGLTEPLPEPVESTRRSNRPTPTEKKKGDLPSPIEVTRRSNRPDPTPIQKDDPPTPTTSFFGPDALPQPIESTRRAHRPINVRPLIPQLVESSMRSSLSRVPHAEMHLELPQPVSVSRWTSRAPGLRRDASSGRPTSPGQYHFTRDRNRPKVKFAAPAADHVWHLEEPIDSTPTSPVESPDASTTVSKCPSLSSSPTSSATSMAWDVPVKSSKILGSQGRRESPDDGFSGYVLTLERKLKQEKIQAEDRAKEGPEYPFPITEDVDTDDATYNDACATRRTGLGIRSESSETIRPKLRAIETEPAIKTQPRRSSSIDYEDEEDNDDYPICSSPRFEAFKRRAPIPDFELLDDHDERFYRERQAPNVEGMWQPAGLAVAYQTSPNLSSPTDSPALSTMSSTRTTLTNGPLTAPARMWHRPGGPSPGYTVASLPPAKRRENTAKEVTPSFVDEVYRYLSLQFENVAGKFDPELAAYTGVDVAEVKRDRKAALTVYCEKWVQENPDFQAGERGKGGLW
ncbi:hypothetical protein BZA05DRAFT_331443 [Tricharina praecox]|uniref:uncharacterized protein n=1 Tax=Tricharina praecox TaxID=43433 RepID=UPI002220963A|nr:uncharacterized protein BZA05DRAFT_331443 [Tricharina praecox]KAI5857734.1 hypothetical protein BZA05DRAFT_331443 [Tricharina praecox]